MFLKKTPIRVFLVFLFWSSAANCAASRIENKKHLQKKELSYEQKSKWKEFLKYMEHNVSPEDFQKWFVDTKLVLHPSSTKEKIFIEVPSEKIAKKLIFSFGVQIEKALTSVFPEQNKIQFLIFKEDKTNPENKSKEVKNTKKLSKSLAPLPTNQNLQPNFGDIQTHISKKEKKQLKKRFKKLKNNRLDKKKPKNKSKEVNSTQKNNQNTVKPMIQLKFLPSGFSYTPITQYTNTKPNIVKFTTSKKKQYQPQNQNKEEENQNHLYQNLDKISSQYAYTAEITNFMLKKNRQAARSLSLLEKIGGLILFLCISSSILYILYARKINRNIHENVRQTKKTANVLASKTLQKVKKSAKIIAGIGSISILTLIAILTFLFLLLFKILNKLQKLKKKKTKPK